MEPYLNVAESYPIYDTIIICSELYGKEKSINGWFTTFRDFARDEKHTFFKSRTIGNSHLAYTNMDSVDTIDFAFKAFSIGVRFFAPCSQEGFNTPVVSPTSQNENVIPFWLFDLPKHVGIDFRVQQDTIVENTCLATPPGYGPRGGGGTMPLPDTVEIARNTAIEANLYLSPYARYIVGEWIGPNLWVLLDEEQAGEPLEEDFIGLVTRFGIQVSLYGYRMVQQRGQYHAPGAAIQPQ
jgi:hypothetical protein